eukprot:2873860-Lingulodinium_polyedra.AAC.1
MASVAEGFAYYSRHGFATRRGRVAQEAVWGPRSTQFFPLPMPAPPEGPAHARRGPAGGRRRARRRSAQ